MYFTLPSTATLDDEVGGSQAAARRFLERAMDLHGVPEKITIDKSGANTAAIVSIQADSGLPIELRQSKYLNNLVEQDHRASSASGGR